MKSKKIVLCFLTCAIAIIMFAPATAKPNSETMSNKFSVVKKRAVNSSEKYPLIAKGDFADPVLNNIVTVMVKDASLPAILSVILKQTEIKFDVVDNVKDMRFTVYLKKLRVGDVFQILAAKNGLSFSRAEGKNLFIVQKATGEFKKFAQLSTNISKQKKSLAIRVRHVSLVKFLDIISDRTNAVFSIEDKRLNNERVTLFSKDIKLPDILEMLSKSKDINFQQSKDNPKHFTVKKRTIPHDFPLLTRNNLADLALDNIMSLSFKNAPLVTLLNVVSEKSKINFILGADAQNIKVSVNLRKVSVLDILQFLETQGLSVSRIGGTKSFIVRKASSATKNFSKAKSKFNDKKYEEAIRIYKELADKYPDSEMADYALLMVAINYDWIAARDNDPVTLKQEEEILKRLIKEYPKSIRLGDAYLYLGQIYSSHGGVKIKAIDCKKAIDFYNLAIKNTYRDWVKAQAKTRIAQCYEIFGNKEKAADIYEEIVAKYPDTEIAKDVQEMLKGWNTLFDAGLVLEKQKKYQLAMVIYNEIIKKNGAEQTLIKKAELRTGICHAAMGETEKAIDIFKKYFSTYNPGTGDSAYFYMGQALKKMGRNEEAQKYLENAKIQIKRKPKPKN